LANALGINTVPCNRWPIVGSDSINPKVGKNIFGCDTLFDHAAKANQSRYPWAQNIIATTIFDKPTNNAADLIQAAHFGLKRIFKPGFSYQRAGVILPDLLPRRGATIFV
jgi:hypothetical protein